MHHRLVGVQDLEHAHDGGAAHVGVAVVEAHGDGRDNVLKEVGDAKAAQRPQRQASYGRVLWIGVWRVGCGVRAVGRGGANGRMEQSQRARGAGRRVGRPSGAGRGCAQLATACRRKCGV
eukprot:363761-Chlamydomonas_euryale.AAC.30